MTNGEPMNELLVCSRLFMAMNLTRTEVLR